MLVAASAHEMGMGIMAAVLIVGVAGGLIYSVVSGRRRANRDRRGQGPDA
jgi:heme/copper-type cytochrome/quinol oxidase subunit 2